jgi:hypothetical protein
MPRSIKVQGKSVAMPPQCVVCLQPAANTYKIDKSFTYGNRTVYLTLPVPMCDAHYGLAMTKNQKEKAVGKMGMIAGIIVGLLVAIGLNVYWASTHQGSLAFNIPLAVFLGVGFFLIVWLATMFWLAPSFANPESKKARRAVRIKAYWPRDDVMQLEFENDRMAYRVAEVNTVVR